MRLFEFSCNIFVPWLYTGISPRYTPWMNNIPSLLHERVDDVPLLIGLMKDMQLAAILNQCLPKHGNHHGLDHGNMAVAWLAFIMSEGDHRKVSVEAWAKTHLMTLGKLLGSPVSEKDFTDDRLGILVKYLANTTAWDNVEELLWERSLRIIPPNGGVAAVRVDASTVSGYHTIIEDSLMQRGNSKAHRPDLGQFKLMSASHQPSGCLIASNIHSGESADDPLYVPIIKRAQKILSMTHVLYLGDCKMAAGSTRAYLVQTEDFYLTPLPMTGKTKELLNDLLDSVEGHPGEVQDLFGLPDGSVGFERSRTERCVDKETKQATEWKERLLVVRTADTAKRLNDDLSERLEQAEQALKRLTPEAGRGKTVFRTEDELRKAITETLEKFDVKGLLAVTLERCETMETKYVGRGRGGKNRPTHEVVDTRYFVRVVKQCQAAIEHCRNRLGWRIFVTNKPCEELPFSQAIIEYRKGWCLERGFHVLKDQPLGISPLYVQTDVQITGLTHLLLLANRILSEIELRVRSSLRAKGQTLEGLCLGSPKKETATPTAVSLLKKVSREEITLTKIIADREVSYHLTPLSATAVKILRHLGINPSIYEGLAEKRET